MIDLKLAKEIGATHFILNDDHSVGLYRISSAHVMFWNESEFWEVYLGDNFYQAERIDFTEPEMVTKYVKVTDSIFDLRDDFEAGGLYFLWGGNYSKVNDEEELLYSYKVKRLYRKVEKPVDWKEVAREFIRSCNELSFDDELGDIINRPDFDPEREEFIELIKRIYPLVK